MCVDGLCSGRWRLAVALSGAHEPVLRLVMCVLTSFQRRYETGFDGFQRSLRWMIE